MPGTVTPEATGDYDDSLPDIYPGPYINKPDEGSVRSATATSIPYYNSLLESPTTAWAASIRTRMAGHSSPQSHDAVSRNVWLIADRRHGRQGVADAALPSTGGAPGRGQPGRSLAARSFLDAGGGTLCDQRSVLHRGQDQHELPDPALHLHDAADGTYALFQSEKVIAIPNTEITKYKTPTTQGGGTKLPLRFSIDTPATLSQFDTKFSTGDIFKSASEICTVHIVPDGGAAGTTPGQNTVAGMPAYWASHALTGDNERERIYTTLYPRLTTKSNTYTVYFTAQSLKQASTSAANTWTDGVDTVQGEYRGSSVIERFIDANNSNIPDYAADASSGSIATDLPLDAFYRWRLFPTASLRLERKLLSLLPCRPSILNVRSISISIRRHLFPTSALNLMRANSPRRSSART